MNIILVGPPGTGKGTMAKLIESEFGFKHISAGDLLRDEVKNNSKLGQKAAPIMNAGKLVDDKLVAQVISANVPNYLETGFILDGFPRNLKQGKILEELFGKIKVKIDLVLLIETNDETIVERLGERRQCPKCNKIYGIGIPPKTIGLCDDDDNKLILRDDDKPQVVMQRLELYHQNSVDLISDYRQKNLLKEIDGNKNHKEVFAQIKKIIFGMG